MSDLRLTILTQATRLLLDRGYRGLSMREIAQAVGVSKAALYYHFKDKEQLFLAILEEYLEMMAQDIGDICMVSNSSRIRIRLLVERTLARPAEQRAVIRLASQEVVHLSQQARLSFEVLYHDKFINQIQSIFQNGIEQGDLRSFDPHVAAWALLGMMYPYFYPAHFHELPDPDQVTRQLVSIFLDGISRTDLSNLYDQI